jgi:pimeloyl-ACP methyl ester carboxylesterase
MSYAEKFTDQLQKYFVVVMWDQRESGKTAELNPSDKPLTVDLIENDAIEVIHYLRKRFSQDKVYVMGHSWGGFLAIKVAADHPELLKACLAVSPMVNQLESERLSLQWMIDKAKQGYNQQALKELGSVHVPFDNGEQLYFHRSWLLKLAGRKSPSKSFVETWAAKWLGVFNEGSAINFFTTVPQINCPVYFFVGRKDYQTHFKITEDYYKMLKAPAKALYWFENSAHNLTTSEPDRLQEIIIREILPKADN